MKVDDRLENAVNMLSAAQLFDAVRAIDEARSLAVDVSAA